MKHIALFILSLCLPCIMFAKQTATDASEKIVVPALVELPEIPEDITDYTQRCNYFVTHYWEPFDFKQPSVGQFQLNHAFNAYVTGIRMASRDVVIKSVDDLLSKLNKNHTLLYQFTKAAEENLYGDNAVVWIDEIYVKFLEAIVKNKKIKDIKKARYSDQLKTLSKTMEGCEAPQFDFDDRNGVNSKFSAEAKPTLIVFGHPDCTDCMMEKVRLDTDTKMTQLAKDNVIKIYYIIPDEEIDAWQSMVKDYPHYWTVGASMDVSDVYDIRLSPTIYVLDSKRKIYAKNINMDAAIIEITENLLSNE